MKVKITHPVPERGYQAGHVYDLTAKEARELIKKDFAFPLRTEEPKRQAEEEGDNDDR